MVVVPNRRSLPQELRLEANVKALPFALAGHPLEDGQQDILDGSRNQGRAEYESVGAARLADHGTQLFAESHDRGLILAAICCRRRANADQGQLAISQGLGGIACH
jgi:hypothetical protein